MRLTWLQFAALLSLVAFPAASPAPTDPPPVSEVPIVYTVLSAGRSANQWDGARLRVLLPTGAERTLSDGFHSAADPEVSFDGERILFAGKRRAGERWQIYEMWRDGTGALPLTSLDADCRQPVYQSRFFTLDAPTPWDQVAFVAGGQILTIPLEAARQAKAEPAPVVFLPGEAREAVIAPDGRMLFSYRERGERFGRLLGVNLDGTDYALFNGEAAADMRMAAVQSAERLVLIESDNADALGGGALSAISLLRPQRSLSRGSLTQGTRFHSPSAMPNGNLIAAARTNERYELVRVDASLGGFTPLHKDATHHLVQPKALAPRPLPDGRGSVVDPQTSWALLYCLNVYTSDPGEPAIQNGTVRRVRVLENPAGGGTALGEAPVEADGSFHLRVPANRPLRLELLGEGGNVLRRGAWIYARNREARGCIGCHEDPELSPANREAIAVGKPAVDLTHRAPAAIPRGGPK